MTVNPSSLAVDHFLRVKIILDYVKGLGKGKVKVGGALRSRARDAASLLLDAGVIGLITFYASKSELDLAGKLHSALRRANDDGMEDFIKGIKADKNLETRIADEVTSEGSGYAILLAMITACLEEYNLLFQGPSYTERVARTLKDLLKDPGKATAAQVILQDYIASVKRLIEAVVKEE